LHTIRFEDGVDEILSLESYRLLGALSDTSNYAVGQQKNNKRSRDDVSSSNSTVVAAEAKRRNHHLDDDTGVAKSTVNDDDDDDLDDVIRQKIRVGDRLARDFDGTIYFGQVEVCHDTKRKNNNEAQPLFDVLFDDGDFFRLELEDVSASLKLYEACRLKEKNDPQIQSKIKAMETEFHENKQQILRQLPTEIKSQFLQIGVAKFDHRSEYMPVLFLSPFHVAWSVRQAWLDKFQKAKSTGYKDFPRLVYWYGEKTLEKSFSFVSAKRCLSYEEACKKGVVAGMPKDIQRKVRKRKKLGKNEQKVYNLWKTLEEELDKSPADRIIFEKPKEDHELVASGERLFMEIESELGRFTKTSDVL